jgi:hypothetical protein
MLSIDRSKGWLIVLWNGPLMLVIPFCKQHCWLAIASIVVSDNPSNHTYAPTSLGCDEIIRTAGYSASTNWRSGPQSPAVCLSVWVMMLSVVSRSTDLSQRVGARTRPGCSCLLACACELPRRLERAGVAWHAEGALSLARKRCRVGEHVSEIEIELMRGTRRHSTPSCAAPQCLGQRLAW